MPNAKRASMREGPLAALFRKTAEDTGAADAPGGEAPAEPEQPTAPSAPSAPPPAAEEQPPPQPPAAREEPPAPREEPRVPSPQERLRHAFSADIPENFMDRPRRDRAAAAPTAPPAAPSRAERDVYARSERNAEAFGVPAPVGT